MFPTLGPVCPVSESSKQTNKQTNKQNNEIPEDRRSGQCTVTADVGELCFLHLDLSVHFPSQSV